MSDVPDTPLDPRLNAYREDLADERLALKVSAPALARSKAALVCAHFADVYAAPAVKSGMQTQIVHGSAVSIFDTADDWSWIQNDDDGYVGYVLNNTLSETIIEATHMVLAPRTFLYPGPDLKLPRCGYRSMGSRLRVVGKTETRGTEYALLDDGSCVIDRHLIEIGDWRDDPVSVAETLLHTPYLWGGNTGFGIDCSGLVQLSNMLCGRTVLRDSDMQAESIGERLAMDFAGLQRGDLVFWNGHVGMMSDPDTLLHANGNTMNVALEPLADAIDRIARLYGEPTLIRRP